MTEFTAKTISMANALADRGWQGYLTFAGSNSILPRCPGCSQFLDMPLLGLGLTLCPRCRIMIGWRLHNTLVGGGVQQWPGIYRTDLFRLAEQYPEKFEALIEQP